MPRLANLLETKLSEKTVKTLRIAGELAESGDAGVGEAFLVGGSVRDLVLGRTANDPDIVVVGNGPRFARQLAERVKGEVSLVSQFGTAVIDSPQGRVDVATARSETYATAGALPDIKPSNMHDDLRRRDFSVNAMAVSIMPNSWGELLDPHKGFSDCARRKLRILHDQSFQDDPTRILRTVRYEVRLGFSMTVETAEAMDRDLHYLDRVTPARVLAEIRKLLAEPRPADALARAEDLSILAAISPALRVTKAGLAAVEKVPGNVSVERELLLLACLTSSLTSEEAETVIRRLQPDNEQQEVIRGAARFREVASMLESPGLLPSEVVEMLEPIADPVLELQRIAGPKTGQREQIDAYLHRHRNVRPELTGDDLAQQGVPTGPMIGQLLEELKTARLDGKAVNRSDETELVRRRLPMLLAREGQGKDQPTGAAIP